MRDRTVTKLEPLPKMAAFVDGRPTLKRVAAYARVSTDHEEQETSLLVQVDYYQQKIQNHPGWAFVKVYADEGISGLSTRHRDSFNQMISDCMAGQIDLVLTKSISRFARNTVDTVTIIRQLREKGIGVYFEKENLLSTDPKGEFILTLMSSLAQEESRSISENVTWGQRKRMSDGKVSLAYTRFLGYDRGPEKFTMVINEEEAVVVRQIFMMFLQGLTPHTISQELTKLGIKTPSGIDVWNQQTIRRMLSNEKYKGDALLQKEFTVDFLQKKMKKNEGELPQYYVEGDHEAIVAPWLFDYVQEQLHHRTDRDQLQGRYSGNRYFSSKIICAKCNSKFSPRPWHSTSYNNLVWQCRGRFASPKCYTVNIYDKLLHYAIHDIARQAIRKRRIAKTVEGLLAPMLSEKRAKNLRGWLRRFNSRDLWNVQSDEADLSLTIGSIWAFDSGTAEVRFIDGDALGYTFPAFSPSQHKAKAQQKPTLREPKKAKKAKKPRNPTNPKKKHPKRTELVPVEITTCDNCGTDIQQFAKRKPRRFCCDKCRNVWWNSHLDQVERKTFYNITCRHCGKTWQEYGDNRKKYCCRACYVAERFGR